MHKKVKGWGIYEDESNGDAKNRERERTTEGERERGRAEREYKREGRREHRLRLSYVGRMLLQVAELNIALHY